MKQLVFSLMITNNQPLNHFWWFFFLTSMLYFENPSPFWLHVVYFNIDIFKQQYLTLSSPWLMFLFHQQNINSEVCEQLFSWLSRYAKITNHMNWWRFMFLMLFLLDNQSNDVDQKKTQWSSHLWIKRFISPLLKFDLLDLRQHVQKSTCTTFCQYH